MCESDSVRDSDTASVRGLDTVVITNSIVRGTSKGGNTNFENNYLKKTSK